MSKNYEKSQRDNYAVDDTAIRCIFNNPDFVETLERDIDSFKAGEITIFEDSALEELF